VASDALISTGSTRLRPELGDSRGGGSVGPRTREDPEPAPSGSIRGCGETAEARRYPTLGLNETNVMRSCMLAHVFGVPVEELLLPLLYGAGAL
jgi:hypothetical protein